MPVEQLMKIIASPNDAMELPSTLEHTARGKANYNSPARWA